MSEKENGYVGFEYSGSIPDKAEKPVCHRSGRVEHC